MAAYYDPFREIQQFVNQTVSQTRSSAMPMDLYSTGDEYVATIDLPGVAPESIDIDVEDGTITVRGERHTDTEQEGATWVARERTHGTFARQITVGAGLALDRITGEYTDGVLRLVIPVAEQAKPRKIQVTRGDSSSNRTTIGGETVDKGDNSDSENSEG